MASGVLGYSDDSLYPYTAMWTPFVQTSIDSNDCVNQMALKYMIGGFRKTETKFISLECNANDNNVTFNDTILFNNKALQNSNLKNININYGKLIAFSFFLSNNSKYGNCIFIVTLTKKFNIYSMDNDNWMFNKNQKFTINEEYGLLGSRALLFDQS